MQLAYVETLVHRETSVIRVRLVRLVRWDREAVQATQVNQDLLVRPAPQVRQVQLVRKAPQALEVQQVYLAHQVLLDSLVHLDLLVQLV